MNEHTMQVIATLRTELPTKFGVPRQSGLVKELRGTVVFEPEYRDSEALRGLEGFSHLWLIWQFSGAVREIWSPTVRPPRLGGNARLGVFATRSPFRPNPLGLSCVKLEAIEKHPADGTVLIVSGVDLMDGTPIYDVKPYLPYADCIPEARGGFAASAPEPLTVEFPPALLAELSPRQQAAVLGVLAQDPRPRYQTDPEREYGLRFAAWDIRFRVAGSVLTVCSLRRV